MYKGKITVRFPNGTIYCVYECAEIEFINSAHIYGGFIITTQDASHKRHIYSNQFLWTVE